jgi:hypothetical protein
MPSILAEELCSVQPMFSPFSKEEWPCQIDILGHIAYKELGTVHEWCTKTLNRGEWSNTAQFYAFKTEEAYTWFKLRWL